MKSTWRHIILVAAMLAATVQQASAQTAAAAVKEPALLGTIGACNNEFPGGPCTQTSTLVQIDPSTGALIREIGPVGFTVNGLAWDPTPPGKLYASTAIGDVAFHGLITINPVTGKGKPVDKKVHNFGLAGADSPIHSVVIDPQGNMVGWYDEFPPGTGDTFVTIDMKTGIATEFNHPGGIDTNQNGVAFQTFGPFSFLWNIDSPKRGTQFAYLLNPQNGAVVGDPKAISPQKMAALGDFNPVNHLYYGLEFTAFDPTAPTFINVVDLSNGTLTRLAQTVDGLHVLAFVKD